jgi:hypothetical protein
LSMIIRWLVPKKKKIVLGWTCCSISENPRHAV